jgi:hypothetical protein
MSPPLTSGVIGVPGEDLSKDSLPRHPVVALPKTAAIRAADTGQTRTSRPDFGSSSRRSRGFAAF